MSAPFSTFNTFDNPHIFADGAQFPNRDEIPTHIIVHRRDDKSERLGPNERPHFYTMPGEDTGFFSPPDAKDLNPNMTLMYRPIGPRKYELVTMPDDVFPPLEKICTIDQVLKLWMTTMDGESFKEWAEGRPESFVTQMRFFVNQSSLDDALAWLTRVITVDPPRVFSNVIFECEDAGDQETRRTWANRICKTLYNLGFDHSVIDWNAHPDFDVRRPDLKSSIGAA